MTHELTTTTATRCPTWMQPDNLERALALAKELSTASLLPEHFRKQPGNVLLMLDQAARWNMSPVAVAQATSIVRGKLMFEGKLVAAALSNSGILDGRLSYQIEGEGQAKRITVTGRMRGESEARSITGSVRDWATSNDAWKRIPDSMLRYRGTREWARAYCPEVILGVVTPDEVEPAPRDVDYAEVADAPAAVIDEPAAAPQEDESPAPQPSEVATTVDRLRDLYRAVSQTAGADAAAEVIGRLCRLHGAESPGGIGDSQDAMADADELMACEYSEMTGLLDAWEVARREGEA